MPKITTIWGKNTNEHHSKYKQTVIWQGSFTDRKTDGNTNIRTYIEATVKSRMALL